MDTRTHTTHTFLRYTSVHPTCLRAADTAVDLPGDKQTNEKVQWRVISGSRSCEENSQGITRLLGQKSNSLDSCKKLCLRHNCRAIDFYASTKWCNLYQRACTNPQLVKEGSSSHYFTGNMSSCVQAGPASMMGILGNADKYVCNAVQAILAHLPNATNTTFRVALASKTDERFWRVPRRRKATAQSSDQRGRRAKEEASANLHRYDATSANTSIEQSIRRRRRVLSVQSPNKYTRRRTRGYTVPSNARPGYRCALAKRNLGDDLLTVVAVVPISPWAFDRRKYLRKYLSASAQKVRSRQLYRQIQSLSAPKSAKLFDWYINQEEDLAPLKHYKHSNYTTYQWGWNKIHVTDPVEDPRAVCAEVVFAVGFFFYYLRPAVFRL